MFYMLELEFIPLVRVCQYKKEALYTALSNGYIAGAGLDVIHGTFMQPDCPLLTLDNVIVTANTAFYSGSSVPEITRRRYEQLGQIFRREWPTWLVNPEVKKKLLERWGEQSWN